MAVDLPRHFVSVAAVIVDDAERVLAIRRRDNGAWEPPGGVLQPAESLEEGLAREVAEEAGVEVEVLRLSGVYKHIDRSIVSLVYLCRCTGDIATDWAETVGVRWMDRVEVASRMEGVFAQRVLDALACDAGPGPRVRNHDGRSFIPPVSQAVAPMRRSIRRRWWDAPCTAVRSCPPSARTATRTVAVVTLVWLLALIIT